MKIEAGDFVVFKEYEFRGYKVVQVTKVTAERFYTGPIWRPLHTVEAAFKSEAHAIHVAKALQRRSEQHRQEKQRMAERHQKEIAYILSENVEDHQ